MWSLGILVLQVQCGLQVVNRAMKLPASTASLEQTVRIIAEGLCSAEAVRNLASEHSLTEMHSTNSPTLVKWRCLLATCFASSMLSMENYHAKCTRDLATWALAVPFNIASYSLLTCMVAQVCGLKPGDFIHTMGNAHVYKNHVEPLTMQLERNPRPFPALKLNPDVKDIDGFQMSDFELSGYNPMSKIAMEMAV